MRRFSEFKSYITRIDYDGERGTFVSVTEAHPFAGLAEVDQDGPASAKETSAVLGLSGETELYTPMPDEPEARLESARPVPTLADGHHSQPGGSDAR
jgi:hypothetical protein